MSYTPPTHTEARALLRGLNLSGSQAAQLANLRDGRTVRRYSSASEKTFTPMPFSVLYTLAHRGAGLSAAPESWREDLATLLQHDSAD